MVKISWWSPIFERNLQTKPEESWNNPLWTVDTSTCWGKNISLGLDLRGWGHSQVAFGSILAELPWLINLKSGKLGIVIVDPSFRLIYALKCLAPSWRDKKKRGSGLLNSIKSVWFPSNFTQCIGLWWGFINHDHEIIPFNQTILTPFWKPRWTPKSCNSKDKWHFLEVPCSWFSSWYQYQWLIPLMMAPCSSHLGINHQHYHHGVIVMIGISKLGHVALSDRNW